MLKELTELLSIQYVAKDSKFPLHFIQNVCEYSNANKEVHFWYVHSANSEESRT